MATSRAKLSYRVRSASQTTPGKYRLWSLAVAALLGLSALAATVSATSMRSGTHSAKTNSGPVLVSTQQLLSDLAEADAAASAAFLSGTNEDPEQRRLYEQALNRADVQMEDIASLAGSDAATHEQLQTISVNVTRYAGLVEAARASNKAGLSGASTLLVDAVALMDQTIQTTAKRLTDAAQARLARDEAHRTSGFSLAVVVLVATLVALIAAQLMMAARSRRVLNLPLLVASALVAFTLAWLVLAQRTSGNDIASARRHGYDSIVLTSQLQTAAFGSKADETLALITGDPTRSQAAATAERAVATDTVTPTILDAIRNSSAGGAPGGLLGQAAQTADTARKRAAVAEMAERWQRYRDTLPAIQSQVGSTGSARGVDIGPTSSTFNGFNFSVEAVLAQNQDQFAAGLTAAANTAGRVPAVALLLPLLALLFAFAGFQLRINDYR